ncbi:hypothetical protein [Stieleria varia]|uniref:Uncharacterized protein n=1 Tax=Stieleria varia TaxID=2528005 RepID=A0A5C6B849_9BACT|nr:hypothetical protein [Stieleria varia]TWU07469.1 hypothetical protein Pla52n_00420 [Stieleria varia]
MSKQDPSQTRETSAFRRMRGCLCFIIFVQCIGVGGRYLFTSHEIESDVYGWLYFDHDWPESVAQTIDNAGSVLTLTMGCCLCITEILRWRRPDLTRRTPLLRLTQVASLWIAIWMLVTAMTHMMRADVYAELTLAEHAVRYTAPVALLVGLEGTLRSSPTTDHWKASRLWGDPASIWLLVLSASATFAAHGYKAIECYGQFTDLILLSDLQWTNLGWGQKTTERILVAIGALDILVAFLLLSVRSRFAAFYMACWGLVTATSRMTALGLDAWPETLIRAANGGVPAAIFIYWVTLRKCDETYQASTCQPETTDPLSQGAP